MEQIVVHDAKLSGRMLTCSITAPKKLKKYFKSTKLFVEYDEEIRADRSILNIPLLAAVLPIAWLTGTDIVVDTLDRTFKESMDELKVEFHKMYTRAPFTTRIKVDKLVDNEIGEIDDYNRTALLFSGGVDSTYSLLTNLDLNPRLLMFWGVDDHAYPENSVQWEHIISTYSEFASEKGLLFNTFNTNNSQILDDRRIEHDFHEWIFDGRLREKLQHSLVLLPLAAPLSVHRFDRLLIASGEPVSPLVRASEAHLNEKIIWGNLTVRHDGLVSRIQKIRGPIREYLMKDRLNLKVCVRKLDQKKLNDSTCFKCVENIVALLLSGIDPNDCGFDVDQSKFENLKKRIINGNFVRSRGWKWISIQKSLPDTIEYDFHGSREFFEWLRRSDLRNKGKKVNKYRKLYNKLPYSISKYLDKIYTKMNIYIHEAHPRDEENNIHENN